MLGLRIQGQHDQVAVVVAEEDPIRHVLQCDGQRHVGQRPLDAGRPELLVRQVNQAAKLFGSEIEEWLTLTEPGMRLSFLL